ncbi:MAG: alpha/beta hydrolase [Chloroflexi bacterium]|nr:alpha/beta hydrolase [Chloroflexota bacterium]
MADVRHHFVQTNGIRMHVAEAGEGFPVVMVHGWPELWYSWRHQLKALSEAGFRAIAPDMRGYGDTDAPPDPAQYRTSVICADIAGLLDALEIEKAVIVGHDWGGYHIWQFGLRYPDRTERLVGLNTPYSPPTPIPSTQALHAAFGEGDRGYYMLYNQKPGQPEAEFEADIRGNIAKVMHPYTRAQDLWTMATLGGDGSGMYTRIPTPPADQMLLTEADLDVYAKAFERSGSRGAFNWYRAIDLNWEDARALPDPVIRVPAMMITAENDLILRPEAAEPMRQWIPNLRIEHIKKCAHWTQQERPEEVNRLLIDFLGDLRG